MVQWICEKERLKTNQHFHSQRGIKIMRALFLCLVLALNGCAYQMMVLPRDGGPAGTGVADQTSINPQGTMSINIDGKTYSGNWVGVERGNTYGLFQAYGTGGARATGFTQMYSSGGIAKALLVAGDGSSMRCDLQYGESTAIGVCQDNKSRIFDVMVTPR